VRLSRIEWSNFRRLPDSAIDLRNHLVLIGPNDVGKSSILRAVHLCVGVTGAQLGTAIQERDFTNAELPLELMLTFSDLDGEERIAFPDEIDLGPPELLRIKLTAQIDPSDAEAFSITRSFPDSGRLRVPSRLQLDTIGWAYIPATRSLIRELGPTAGGAIHSLISSLNFEEDAEAIQSAIENMRNVFDESKVFVELRTELADALSGTLPRSLSKEDLHLRNEAEVTGDPLRGVVVTVKDNGTDTPLSEQSDGFRAMSLLAILGVSHRTAKIVGIDEPETHLHASAQRTIGKALAIGLGQQLVATHSSAIVSQMNPLDIVVIGTDHRVRQLPLNSPLSTSNEVTRHWSARLLEPLTSRRLIIVEGPADRIILQGLAQASGIDLDRCGAVIFELDGSGFFGTAYEFFGPNGFDLPLSGVLDEDARIGWAKTMNVDPATLEAEGFVVNIPDLEAVYIDALGTTRIIELLAASGMSEVRIRKATGLSPTSSIGQSELQSYCGKRKVICALAVANGFRSGDSKRFLNFIELLKESI
jgi:putative ATP-dependent endonuclease of OLD family